MILVIPFVNIDAIKYSFNVSYADKYKIRKNMNSKQSQKCPKM